MGAAGKFDPPPRAQVFLAEQNYADQGGQRCDVHPVDLFEHGLIVQQADQEHGTHTGQNPIDLFEMGAGELGVLGRAVDLQHAQRAEHQHEAQQDPVEISVGNVARH